MIKIVACSECGGTGAITCDYCQGECCEGTNCFECHGQGLVEVE